MGFCPDPTPIYTEAEKLRMQAEELIDDARKLDDANFLKSDKFKNYWKSLRFAAGLSGESKETLEVQIVEIIKKIRKTSDDYTNELWKNG